MPGHVIFVVGLPGSGKTTYLRRFQRQLQFEVFDDFKANAFQNNRGFAYSKSAAQLVDALTAGRTCVVSDIDFCRTEARVEAERFLADRAPNSTLEWRYFACDVAKCRANVVARGFIEHRNVDLELNNIGLFARSYQIPPGSIILEVQSAG